MRQLASARYKGKKIGPFSVEHRQKISAALKGKTRTDEHCKNISRALVGRLLSDEHKQKIGRSVSGEKNGFFGRVHSEKTRLAISNATKGDKSVWYGRKHSEEELKKMRGRKDTEEQRKKKSESLKGDKAYQWKGGVTPINKRIRNSWEYKQWRLSVFERDDYTCVLCKRRGGYIHADHIKSFSEYPSLRLDINNGRTLCVPCHRSTETYGWRGQGLIRERSSDYVIS